MTRSIQHFFLSSITTAALFLAPSSLWAQQDKAETQTDDLKARLAVLDDKLEEQRVKLHIPGLAIAIVKDDSVIFSKGFGLRDVAGNKPVTPETIFAIGSTTKAFTSTLIGMLADDSIINFDDPVTKNVPEFELDVDTGDDEVTIRDLLCHRTGFTRMSILWAASKATRPEVIEHAATAKPMKKFREAFQYNNVMFLVAGYSAGQAADSDWETLIAERIFRPLGMTSSNTSVAQSQQDERLSIGYDWDKDAEKFKVREMRDLDLIGPAGSINSNLIDMAQWVRFQLARGAIDGKRLISEQNLGETWKQQIEIAPGIGYGLGWMVRQWNGQSVIEHGGNIDGFSAQVSLLPEQNLGYVLLANVTATPLQGSSIGLVFDTLVGQTVQTESGLQGISTDGLIGKYVANFGPFRDERFTVQVKDGNLAVDVPGQRLYELKAPNEEGKWYFALTDQIAVSFATDEDGRATSLTMYQAGFEFECPREGVERKPDVPLSELTPLLGSFRDEQNNVNVKIIVNNNRLAAQVEGQGLMEFLPPDAEGRWAMRAAPDRIQIRFNKDDDGRVNSITRFQSGNENEMPRVAHAEATEMISTEELLAKMKAGHGGERAANPGNIKMVGTVSFVHQGAKGTVEMLVSSLDRHATRMDIGKLGYVHEAFNGKQGWTDSAFSPFEELTGTKLKVTKHKHPLWFLGNWQEDYTGAAVIGDSELDGEKVFLLKFSSEDLPNRTLHVSAKTGLILKEETAVIAEGIGQFPVTVKYSDYRDVDGVMLPFSTSTETSQTGATVIQFESSARLEEIPDEQFVLKSNGDRK